MLLLVQLLDVYSLIVFGSVIVSWVGLPPTHAVVGFLTSMTEPFLAPIRRVMPDMGGLDFSPMVLLIGVRMVRGIVLSAAVTY